MRTTTQKPVSIAASRYARVQRSTQLLIVALLALLWPSYAQAQTYTISPSPFLIAFDNSGNIINNACVWTYLAGGNTPADTYQTSSGTLNLNPIRSDSAGRFTAFLQPGISYKFVYESACTPPSHGTTLRTADNIAAVPVSGLNVDVDGTAGETIAAGAVVYLSDGSGGNNAGQWYNTDADNPYSSSTAVSVGVTTAAIDSGDTGTIRVSGRITGLSALSPGELYYVSATAGGLTATPPTNAWLVGKADSATSIIVGQNQGAVRLPDSDGTHSLVFRSSGNLSADQTVTFSNTSSIELNQTTTTTSTTVSFNQFRPPQGRCTLTSATPITTADVTAATTLYYALYGGNQITLYDGSTRWVYLPFTELSIAVPNTMNTMYDVFVDYTAGTPALEVVAWTNDTTRATALTTQNGVYVQTADTDSLYVCSFRTTGSAGQTEDSFAKRYVWNYYNRVVRPMRVLATADSWTYADSATWRQAGAATTNQLDFVVGVAEVMLYAEVYGIYEADTANDSIYAGIGLDSTTATATGNLYGVVSEPVATYFVQPRSILNTYPAVGRHFAAWLERCSATCTGYGDNASDGTRQSGMSGWLEN